MPRTIATIGRERSIGTLAQRLFVITGPNKKADLARAERALLRDNPALAEAEGFRSGAIVVVPSDIGLATTDRVERSRADRDGLLQESVLRVQMSEAVARKRFAESQAETKAALERLNDQRFTEQLKKSAPDAAKLVQEARKSLESRMAEDEERQAKMTNAIEEAIAALVELRNLAAE